MHALKDRFHCKGIFGQSKQQKPSETISNSRLFSFNLTVPTIALDALKTTNFLYH